MLELARETVAGTYFILLSSEHWPAAMPAIILQFVLLYFSDVFVCFCFPVKHREPRAQCVQVCASASSKGIAGVHTRLSADVSNWPDSDPTKICAHHTIVMLGKFARASSENMHISNCAAHVRARKLLQPKVAKMQPHISTCVNHTAKCALSLSEIYSCAFFEWGCSARTVSLVLAQHLLLLTLQ